MRKFLLLLVGFILTFSVTAAVKSVYVNPMQNQSGVDAVIAKRLYKKALLGLTKSKTISISSGSKDIAPGSEEAQKYDYILSINLAKVTITEKTDLGKALSSLLNSSNSKTKDPEWNCDLSTNILIVNAKTGSEVFKTTLTTSSSDKDKSIAMFDATNNFDYEATDMIDDAFRVKGEVMEATEIDKKNVVKKVRMHAGSKDGVRKNQTYEIYKVVGDKKELIGFANCEQVLSNDESILSIKGKKDGDKVISELIQNGDGSYIIEAWSRSRNNFLHNNFQFVDKMFSREGRSYLDPFNRSAKPKIGFLAVEINDNSFSAQKENFQGMVIRGMKNVPTIELNRIIYPSVEAALEDGMDGVIEITIDKVFNTTSKDKEGKTYYKTKILYTVAGIDVVNNKWIDMKSYSGFGTSKENAAKSNAGALGLMDDKLSKFSEDIFPVSASVLNTEEVNKKSVKKIRINVGTNMGVKKGMAFDIFEQRAEGGADSRFLLGEGKVEKDGLSPTEAILKVKGKNNGDEKLYELLQNIDEDTEIVLVSKASYNLLDKVLNNGND